MICTNNKQTKARAQTIERLRLVRSYNIGGMLKICYRVLVLFYRLQFPRITHHQVKVRVTINRSADAGVVVQELLTGDLVSGHSQYNSHSTTSTGCVFLIEPFWS